MFDGQLTRSMGTYFAGKFANLNADYVVTVETKGISLAADVAFMMNLPLVVVRREAKIFRGFYRKHQTTSPAHTIEYKKCLSQKERFPKTSAL